jgi:nucleoside-diphosphate-sugar epimerase
VASSRSGLTVAVTGPTGTFGFGLIPLLQADDRIAAIAGIARRPFDPAAHGWSKMRYREGDVRDRAALEAAFAGADVVVHLAFNVAGRADRQTLRAINVDGTMNAFAAAAAAGVTRFVYASSVAAYGFDSDNPVGLTEEWPARPAEHLFYAREKAEIERRLQDASAAHPQLALYVVRPPIVLGPHAVGAKAFVPGPLEPLVRRAVGVALRLPVALPVALPPLPVQLIHEQDVGDALRLCAVGAGPPGIYNLAGDGVLTAVDLAREAGLWAIAVPRAPVQAAARLLAALPFAPPSLGWAEAMASPVIMDTAKARRELGWHPRWTAREALRETLDGWRAR